MMHSLVKKARFSAESAWNFVKSTTEHPTPSLADNGEDDCRKFTNMALTVSPAHTIQTDSTSSASLLKSSASIIGSSICEPDNGGHHKHSATSATATAYETGDLELYEDRLRTFENWPNNEMAPSRLAAAGFYYTKRTDVVKCPFCGTEGCQWQSEDNPLSDHLEWSPRCPFLLNLTRNSQSSSSAVAASASTSAAPQDECGKYTNCLSETIPEALRKFAVDQTKPCSHPTFISLESRLKSFELWPKSLKQKPGDLAQAGFYYTGQGDQTLCFNCGGGLKDWEEQDVPWEQHALWFPKCTYLLLAKGRQYVEDVQSAEQQQQQQSSAAAGTSSAGSNNNNSNDSASAAASTTDDLTKDERKPNDSDDLGSAASSSSNSNPQNENSTTLCKICYRNEMSVMFLPCNHIVSCVDCAMSLRDSCPICRKKVQASFRVFLT